MNDEYNSKSSFALQEYYAPTSLEEAESLKKKEKEMETDFYSVFKVERMELIVCNQCNKEILDGQRIYMDSVGYFPPKIEDILNNLQIYHYDSLVSKEI